MRELKFRIGGKSSGGFRYLDKGELINLCSLIPWDGSLVAKDHGRNVIVPKEAYIIEQYTGLKDKNGREIYDGDILGGIWESGFISWCERCKQLQYHSAGIGCMACSGDVHWCEIVEDNGKLEVIGNIHENHELLKEEE